MKVQTNYLELTSLTLVPNISIDLSAFQSVSVCSNANFANFGGSKSCAGKAGAPIDRTFADLDFVSVVLFELYCACSEVCLATVFAKNNSTCSPLKQKKVKKNHLEVEVYEGRR